MLLPVTLAPPKTTRSPPDDGSGASTVRVRAPGVAAGLRSVQSLPSHVQVSPSSPPSSPPYSTVWLSSVSYAMPAFDRADGLAVGVSSTQPVPVHTHVSPR